MTLWSQEGKNMYCVLDQSRYHHFALTLISLITFDKRRKLTRVTMVQHQEALHNRLKRTCHCWQAPDASQTVFLWHFLSLSRMSKGGLKLLKFHGNVCRKEVNVDYICIILNMNSSLALQFVVGIFFSPRHVTSSYLSHFYMLNLCLSNYIHFEI